MTGIDQTHDPALKSFIASANVPGCDFPIQNLPYVAFRRHSAGEPRIGVAIGDEISRYRRGWGSPGWCGMARCRSLCGSASQ